VYDVDPPVEAVKHVTLDIKRGEIVGLAGESGSGKTTLAYGVQRLLKPPAVITSGSVVFHDESGEDIDLHALDPEAMRRFRWDKISMVFQGAMNALNPVATIGAQLDDVFLVPLPLGQPTGSVAHAGAVRAPLTKDEQADPLTQATGELAIVNLRSSWADGQPSGITSETLTIQSMVGTLRENLPEITQVKFLVDGKPRDTLAGNVELDRVFDVNTTLTAPAQTATHD